MPKEKTRKCEDGVKRKFVRRKVQLVEVWNALIREYEKGGEKYADVLLDGDPKLVSFFEGYNAALVASLHILRHYRDGDIVELPVELPEAYIEIKTADAEIKAYVDKLLEEKEKEENA